MHDIFERDKFFAFLQLKAITLSVISIFKTSTQMKQQCHQDSTPLVFIRYKATKKAMDTIKYTSVYFNNKKLSFLFVSRCSHVWCRLQRFNCILLVFFRRWGRLVMRDLIKHNALLWLVHFNPCCSLSDLLPWRSAVTRLSCCCVSWSWASTLLEFLFHYRCWCC